MTPDDTTGFDLINFSDDMEWSKQKKKKKNPEKKEKEENTSPNTKTDIFVFSVFRSFSEISIFTC